MMTTNSFDNKVQKKTATSELSVLLTQIEWIRLVSRGYVRIDSTRILSEDSSLLEHVQHAPDVGEYSDSYVLCKISPDGAPQSNENLGYLLSLQNVSVFQALTETGRALLESSQGGKYVRLTKVFEEGAWEQTLECLKQRESHNTGLEFCKLFQVAADVPQREEKNNPLSLSLEALKIKKSEKIDANISRFLGTPAGGYKLALTKLQDRDQRDPDTKRASWTPLRRFKPLFEEERRKLPDQPIFTSKLFREVHSEVKRLATEISSDKGANDRSKHPSHGAEEAAALLRYFLSLLFIYHYSNLVDNEKEVNVRALISDVHELEKLLGNKTALGRSLYILGSRLPPELVTYWTYLSKDPENIFPTAIEAHRRYSFKKPKEATEPTGVKQAPEVKGEAKTGTECNKSKDIRVLDQAEKPTSTEVPKETQESKQTETPIGAEVSKETQKSEQTEIPAAHEESKAAQESGHVQKPEAAEGVKEIQKPKQPGKPAAAERPVKVKKSRKTQKPAQADAPTDREGRKKPETLSKVEKPKKNKRQNKAEAPESDLEPMLPGL